MINLEIQFDLYPFTFVFVKVSIRFFNVIGAVVVTCESKVCMSQCYSLQQSHAGNLDSYNL